MQRIQAVSLANSFGMGGPRRWVAIGLAGLLNIALVYALVTGLAARFAEQIPSIIHVAVVKQPPSVQHKLPPPAPELAAPKVPEIPVPQIRIARPAPHAITAIAVPKPAAMPPKPMPVTHVIPPVPARAVEGTHTTPSYPPIARRLGQEGIVRLRIALDSNGAIRNVDIAKSSGSETLDHAAAEWVSRHWRYKPAMRDGKPVATIVLADVKFDLRSASYNPFAP